MNALYSTARRLTAVLVALVALGTLAPPVQAQSCETGSATVDLDINNVRARLYNIGGLFWRGSGAVYEVPKGSGLVSIFASGIWVGGEVDGQLRFAGSTYGPWEYWPGPLDATGNVTASTCQQFDRFWSVTISDIRAYESTGVAPSGSQLGTWPIAYGAPFFVDTNGNGRRDPTLDDDDDGVFDEPRQELTITDAGYGSRQIDLAAGERPDIIGDQGIWWVMNDKGGSHDWGGAPAIGLEVQAQAFAFSRADALNNATFYKYKFIYRGTAPMQNTYLGIFSDPDLGNFNDDYVGSDPELGLGFVYNGDENDDGGGGYGQFPPALGYDFFQGPLVNADGIDNDGDGTTDEDDERLAIEKFFYFTNQPGVTGDPSRSADEAYLYMQGLWKDGTPLKLGGDGYNTNGPQVDFAFPADPPEFWSEYDSDGNGTANTPADRRFGVSSGPFTFNPGDTQEIVFGIVWSQAVGATNLPQIASVNKLKIDDATLQSAFDNDFALPEAPPEVDLMATGLDQEIILEWDSSTGDLGDIFGYDVFNPFSPVSATDRTYTFEGFRVFQYRDETDTEGVQIADFDIANGITTIVDTFIDPATGLPLTQVVANGTDNGSDLRTPTTLRVTSDAFSQQPLRNGTSYYFGVRAYAINEASVGQKVFLGAINELGRVEVRPTKIGSTIPVVGTGTAIEGAGVAGNVGEGSVNVRVANPGAVTGDTYAVQFFTAVDNAGDPVGTAYNIVNQATGAILFDGQAYYNDFGQLPPQRADAFRADGLIFDVLGPDDSITNFLMVSNSGGPIVPATGAAAEYAGFPAPAGWRASSGTQQLTDGNTSPDPVFGTDAIWFFSTGGRSNFAQFIDRTYVSRGNEPYIFPFDFEMRFTGTSLAAKTGIFGQAGPNVTVPFEIWNTGIGTPDDTSDDFRLIPVLLDIDDDGTYNLSTADSELSSALNDPETDWIYWYTPVDESPGEAGYMAWETSEDTGLLNHEVFARTTLVGWNLGTAPPYSIPYPESGSVIRITTAKPNQPGDTFEVVTGDEQAVVVAEQTAAEQEAALDLMAITPNPYRGFSGYEASGNQSVARFVNVPPQATIRIYTLSGTLIRTIEKNSPGNSTIDWDLKTEASLPVASGMYLIHIEARQASGTVIGERVLKFGVIQRRTQLDVL